MSMPIIIAMDCRGLGVTKTAGMATLKNGLKTYIGNVSGSRYRRAKNLYNTMTNKAMNDILMVDDNMLSRINRVRGIKDARFSSMSRARGYTAGGLALGGTGVAVATKGKQEKTAGMATLKNSLKTYIGNVSGSRYRKAKNLYNTMSAKAKNDLPMIDGDIYSRINRVRGIKDARFKSMSRARGFTAGGLALGGTGVVVAKKDNNN